MRREFLPRVKREISERARQPDGITRCEGCGMDLTGKKAEIDHILAESLVPEFKKRDPVTGKIIPLTAAEGQLLGECCHRGEDGKTKKDTTAAAKEKRVHNKYVGFKTKKQKIQGRGFASQKKTPTFDKSALPPLPPAPLMRD